MSQNKPPAGRPLSRVDAARNGPRVPVFVLAAGALVVVLVVAVAVVALTRGDDDVEVSAGGDGAAAAAVAGDVAFGPVTVEGEALAPYSGTGEDPAVGQPAPTLTGIDPSGDPVTVDPGADGPMVVSFLAHWCPHCQAEVPRLVDLADAAGEVDGVRLAAVTTSSSPDRPNFPPGEWLASEDWPGPVMVDSEAEAGQLPTAAAAYSEDGFPFLVAIDADGDVVARESGEMDEDGLRAFIDQAGTDGRWIRGDADPSSPPDP